MMDVEIMNRMGLSHSELQFFSTLKECSNISSSELGKKMNLSPSRVSRIVDRLVTNDFLDRSISVADRRAITLRLTEKGEDVAQQIEDAREHCNNKINEVLSPSEVDAFSKALNKIVEVVVE
ncbi:MarR family winged helix-turn-helix transcriptional regulator [Halosquirtibacter xylanolyticus]|uniref:MarR family winged helix-turn-helix transcriptional regulator n=1 Tax=Halosquirtibacter xylanolyticus TaxID=3374599 RepID=UPI003747AA11|nr:MarR family winged helix-turn-helix transcriptional regulator [Prolixibacteraceae bacterium]